MGLEIGSIHDGKVTGITKFGAFIALSDNKGSGMVHISEIAETFVNDIRDYLKEGQTVTVKILGEDNVGRYNLSIKRVLAPKPAKPRVSQYTPAPRTQQAEEVPVSSVPPVYESRKNSGTTFEDQMKQFKQDSESRMSDLMHYIDKKGGSSRKPRK